MRHRGREKHGGGAEAPCEATSAPAGPWARTLRPSRPVHPLPGTCRLMPMLRSGRWELEIMEFRGHPWQRVTGSNMKHRVPVLLNNRGFKHKHFWPKMEARPMTSDDKQNVKHESTIRKQRQSKGVALQ